MGGLREIKMSFSNLEQKAAVHCRVLDYLMLLDTFFFFCLVVNAGCSSRILLRRT